MKNLIRSNSDTNFFFENAYINLINTNINKLKTIKNFQNKEEFIKKKKTVHQKKTEMLLEMAMEEINEKTTNNQNNVEQNKIEKTFKNYIKMIYIFKLDFDKNYLNNVIMNKKLKINLVLEIILIKIHQFRIKFNLIDQNFNNSFSKEEGLAENLNRFENILQILIQSPLEELYKEVKSMILNEFEALSIKINNYFEVNKNVIVSNFFNNMSIYVLFTISSFAMKTDYYSFTINTLVDKLNRFFIDLVSISSNSKEIFRSLIFVEKFIKIKRSFLKDVCYNKIHFYDETSLFNYNKFCSFGRYFFNNINEIIDLNEDPKNFPKPHNGLFITYKLKYLKERKWKNNLTESRYINKFFIIYFNSKLMNWKVSILKENQEKSNTCRVCEKKFLSRDFLMHSWFCKEINTYVPEIKKFSNKIELLLNELEKHKTEIQEKDNIISSYFTPSVKIDFTPNDKYLNRPLIEKMMQTPRQDRKDFLMSVFIKNLHKEKNKIYEIYSKNPYHLINLNTIIYFSIKMFSQNKNYVEYSDVINKIFSRLFSNLMKKQIVIEYVLTFKEMYEKTKSKITSNIYSVGSRKYSIKSQESGRDLSIRIDEVKSILTNKGQFRPKNKMIYSKSPRYSSIFIKGESSQIDDNTNYSNNRKSYNNFNKKKINMISNELKTLEIPLFSCKIEENKEKVDLSITNSKENKSTSCEFLSNISGNNTPANKDKTYYLNYSSNSPNDPPIFNSRKNSIAKSKFSDKIITCPDEFQFQDNSFDSFDAKDYNTNNKECNQNTINNSAETPLNNNQNSPTNIAYNNEINLTIIENEVESEFEEIIEIFEDFNSNEIKNEFIKNTEKDEKNIELLKRMSNDFEEIFNFTNKSTNINDYTFLKNISKGGYGIVDMYRKNNTGDIYVIKSVDIEFMVKIAFIKKSKNITNLLKIETTILNKINHDFVVKCYYIFQDLKKYYFVMEYIPGGDLGTLMNSYQLSVETIKLIAVDIILALEYIHNKNIVHRDLKPENILITKKGHFKLIDFGISEIGLQKNRNVISKFEGNEIDNFYEPFTKILMQNNEIDLTIDEKNPPRKKILGTAYYMAPEIIKEESITDAVDYWALGVILYECFTEKLPFPVVNSVSTIFDNILNLKIDWSLLENAVHKSPKAFDFIKNLLHENPNERFNHSKLKLIKNHPFFSGVNWDNIKETTNVYLKKYVIEKMKKNLKKEIYDNNLFNCNNTLNSSNDCDGQVNSDYYAKKIENLYEKNKAEIENDFHKKVLEIDLEKVESVLDDLY